MTKTFILDTCVLIHDPDCVNKFEEHEVVIPSTVLEELDNLKDGKRKDVSYSARKALKNILENKDIILFPHEGEGKPDNLIVEACLEYTEESDNWDDTILLTNDVTMQIKAEVEDIQWQPYKNDTVEAPLKSSAAIEDEDGDLIISPWTKYIVKENCVESYPAGEVLWKKDLELFDIKPKNAEQCAAMAALLDETLELVVLEATAGAGKTLLSLAYALEANNRYDSIIIMRDTNHVGEDIGYLPGSEEEKMAPWLEGFVDNLKFLVGDDKLTHEVVMSKYDIQFRSISLTRGRSYVNTLIIWDEAQCSNFHQAKTLLTRVGPGSKIVVLGNLDQIDVPALNKNNSGLRHICDKMVDYKGAAVITLHDVERSELAKWVGENF